jgi:Kef-type K+ transport system membrane component KefB
MSALATLVAQIGVVLVAARVVARLFRKIHQPQVVGEMVAGIMLGPSLLGWAAPKLSAFLFPASTMGNLNSLSQIGLVLFMFLVGLSINPRELKGFGNAAVLVSHVSIVAPFTLAAGLSLLLYPRFSDSSVPFTGFALFMGAAMSITAFPVLARILSERGLLRTRIGTLSIACAAVDDVTGWCILAGIVVLIRSVHSSTPVWITLTGSVAFVLTMFLVVKRLLARLEGHYVKHAGFTETSITLIIVLVMVSALTTELLGIHLLFGAFLAGVVMPKNQAFAHSLREKFESVTVALLLPLYFAFTGLRTRIGLVRGPEMWAWCAAIIVVAIAGKLGGSMTAARTAGMCWSDSAVLGILMNTRGLMELVILNIGLDLGIISPALFSMMILMALITTFMTTPLLRWVSPRLHESPIAQSSLEATAAV